MGELEVGDPAWFVRWGRRWTGVVAGRSKGGRSLAIHTRWGLFHVAARDAHAPDWCPGCGRRTGLAGRRHAGHVGGCVGRGHESPYKGVPRKEIAHGTNAGYAAHRRRGEEACRDCKDAHSKRELELRRRRG